MWTVGVLGWTIYWGGISSTLPHSRDQSHPIQEQVNEQDVNDFFILIINVYV